MPNSSRPADHVRPYGDDAPWNVTADTLATHSQSDSLVDKLWNDAPPSGQPGNFNLGFDDYTYPVYYAADATGMYTVDTASWANLDGEKMPWNPAWDPAPGTDAQVIVLDPETGREWNLWQVSFDDGVINASNGNLVSGNYFTKVDGFFPSRGVGIQYYAMLVQPEEIAAGKIEHALSMPIRNVSPQFVAPGTKSDGRIEGGIPEGTRFELTVTEAEIDAWIDSLPDQLPESTLASARVIAEALNDYGWFIADRAGGATWQFEARTSAGDLWDDVGLGATSVAWEQYPRDLMDGLLIPDRIRAIVPSDEYGSAPPPDPDPETPPPSDTSGPVDLIAASGQFDVVEDPLSAGQAFDVQFAIENDGTGTAGTFNVDFFLSLNSWISDNDRYLGSRTIDGVAGNSTTGALTETLTLPGADDGFWQGDDTYYVGMIVDNTDVIDETNESNNYRTGQDNDHDGVFVTLSPAPPPDPDPETPPPSDTSGPVDLIAASGQFDVVEDPLSAGQAFDVQFAIENDGTGTAGTFNVDFFLSLNSWISDNDRYLGSRTIDGVAGNSTTGALTETLTLPGADDGFWQGDDTYYVGMIVDNADVIDETNESNNYRTGQDNDHDGVFVTLSPAPPPDPDPETPPPSDTSGPVDLIAASGQFDVVEDPLSAGQAFDVQFAIENDGTGTAGTFNVDFFLSLNSWISDNDRYLGSRTIDGVAGNSTTGALTETLTLPGADDGFWQGDDTYYVGMIVDNADVIDETNESNNYRTGQDNDHDGVFVTLSPAPPPDPDPETPPPSDTSGPVDLIAASGQFDVVEDPLSAGQAFDVQFAIENDGTGTAGTFNVDFFLSLNSWISDNDRYLGSRTIDGVAGNSTTGALTETLTLPGADDGFWQGDDTYYVGMIVDNADVIDETNESNNYRTGQDNDYDSVFVA